MSFAQTLQVFEAVDTAHASGRTVVKLHAAYDNVRVTVTRISGQKGSTDFVRIEIPDAPTRPHEPVDFMDSPYANEPESLAQAAELLVMDCMGFVEAHREVAARASGLPVILSNALIARLTAEPLS